MNKKLQKITLALFSISLLFAVGIIAVRAQDSRPQTSHMVFIPISNKNAYTGHIIQGRVLNPQNAPIAGVTIRTDQGQAATTDQNGDYQFQQLAEGNYTLTPALSGVTFSPASSAVVVPPDVGNLNFTADVVCSEAIVNGGFETNTGWIIPVTPYPAAYSSAQAHSGSRSMRTGIVNLADNVYSYSSAQQKVTIPSGTTSAYLTFWIKPYSGEAQGLSLPTRPEAGSPMKDEPLSGDVQYVLVLDNNYNIIKTLVWQLSDSRTWTAYQFSLAAYAGQSIWLHYGTYNDGYGGVSSLYVDDVSFTLCPGGGTATPTPTQGQCTNLFHNPGFETVSDWEIPVTVYPAGYSNAQAHAGNWSMRTGIVKTIDNIYSYSDFRQAVRIPSGTGVATARFWLYSLSGEAGTLSTPEQITPTGRPFAETPLSGDLQYVLVLDQYQNWIDTLIWQRADQGYWHHYEFDLRPYAGRTIYLQFGTYNDGANGITSMYVDDVSLDNCNLTPTPGASPTPTRTPTPTQVTCQERIVNNNFSNSDGWVIPNTDYPAAYSYAQYHSAYRSMRSGIVNPADNTFSYSDFRQAISIPSTTHHVTLSTWLYPTSGELILGDLPMPSRTTIFGLQPLDYDVQYLLILDRYQNWIDTLVWMRSNSQVWTNMQFDLSAYAGTTIMLQWGTYNNGAGGVTSMYVDDVTVQACP